jgi:hypothetical protein
MLKESLVVAAVVAFVTVAYVVVHQSAIDCTAEPMRYSFTCLQAAAASGKDIRSEVEKGFARKGGQPIDVANEKEIRDRYNTPMTATQPATKWLQLPARKVTAEYNVESAIAEIDNCAGRHTHPGVESSYVMEGALLLKVEGRPDQTLKAGEFFKSPPNTPHDTCAIPGQVAKVLTNYVVVEGKPAP